MDMLHFPNTFILGVPKAGTTTLLHLLKQHPDVFAPYKKEPKFFCNEDNFSKGHGWFSNQFYADAGGFKVRLDGSVTYFYHGAKVAPRLKAACPENGLRFILVFRNPVDVAYSLYWNSMRWLNEKKVEETLSFAEALAAENNRLRKHSRWLDRQGTTRFAYFHAGCYATQLETYLQYFSKNRFHFILFEDLTRNPAAVTAKLSEFLDIDPRFKMEILRLNESAVPRSKQFQRLILGENTLKDVAKKILPQRSRETIKKALMTRNMVKISYPPIRPEIEQSLKKRFKEEIIRLESLIERDLSPWYE